MKRLGLCLLAHQLCVLMVPNAWLVPNFALVGLVLATIDRPAWWAWYALLTGAALLPWLASGSGALLLLVSGLAAGVAALVHQFELHDARLQHAILAAAAALFTAWMLSGHAPSWSLGASALGHVAATVLAAVALRSGRRAWAGA